MATVKFSKSSWKRCQRSLFHISASCAVVIQVFTNVSISAFVAFSVSNGSLMLLAGSFELLESVAMILGCDTSLMQFDLLCTQGKTSTDRCRYILSGPTWIGSGDSVSWALVEECIADSGRSLRRKGWAAWNRYFEKSHLRRSRSQSCIQRNSHDSLSLLPRGTN